MFNVNQKVICTDDAIPPEWQKLLAPIMEGTIYTIRDIVRGTRGKPDEEEVAVYLKEYNNPANAYGIEFGYSAERFAPLEPPEEIEEHEQLTPCVPVERELVYTP